MAQTDKPIFFQNFVAELGFKQVSLWFYNNTLKEIGIYKINYGTEVNIITAFNQARSSLTFVSYLFSLIEEK